MPRRLRRMTQPAERRKLLQALVDLEQAIRGAKPGTSWKWDAVLVVIVASCIVLGRLDRRARGDAAEVLSRR